MSRLARISTGLQNALSPFLFLLLVEVGLWIYNLFVEEAVRWKWLEWTPFTWYYLLLAIAILYFSSFWLDAKSPEGKQRAEKIKGQEAEQQELKKARIEKFRAYYQALTGGNSSAYPTMEATNLGIFMRSNEICYLALPRTTIGRGIVHQLEHSAETEANFDGRVVKFGGKTGLKDSYSTIRYDDRHPGNLVITNQRIVFVSPPAIFLEVLAREIVTVAWNERYVMIRTSVLSDDDKDVLAFSIDPSVPAWLVAAAAFRIQVDSGVATNIATLSPPDIPKNA